MWSSKVPLRAELEIRRIASELEKLQEKSKEPAKSTASEALSNPTWLAILGALIAVATGAWQLQANRELEREKLRSTLILEASKSGSPETTLKNLQFLVKAGLIQDENGAIMKLTAAEAPSFSTASTRPFAPTDLVKEFGDPKLTPVTGEGVSPGSATADPAWIAENLVELELPQLVGVEGFPKSGKIRFHHKAAPYLRAAVEELAQKGLISHIKSFDGAWSPRMVRSGSGRPSAHAYGVAFDVNSRFSGFGSCLPAGKEGSNVEIAEVLERHGFFWGGQFPTPDCGHFQYGVKPSEEPGGSSAAVVP